MESWEVECTNGRCLTTDDSRTLTAATFPQATASGQKGQDCQLPDFSLPLPTQDQEHKMPHFSLPTSSLPGQRPPARAHLKSSFCCLQAFTTPLPDSVFRVCSRSSSLHLLPQHRLYVLPLYRGKGKTGVVSPVEGDTLMWGATTPTDSSGVQR